MSDRGREGFEGKSLASVPEPAAIPGPLVDLVLDSLRSPHSRRAYGRALSEFFSWYPSNASGEGFTRATLQRYRSHLQQQSLSAASINLHLAAVRKLATEASAAILRVPGARRTGVRTGNWAGKRDNSLKPRRGVEPTDSRHGGNGLTGIHRGDPEVCISLLRPTGAPQPPAFPSPSQTPDLDAQQ